MKILLRVIWQCKGVGEGTRQPREGSPPHSTVSSHVSIYQHQHYQHLNAAIKDFLYIFVHFSRRIFQQRVLVAVQVNCSSLHNQQIAVLSIILAKWQERQEQISSKLSFIERFCKIHSGEHASDRSDQTCLGQKHQRFTLV